MKIKFSISFLTGLVVALPMFGQNIDSSSFDQYIQNAVKQYDIPALSVSLTNEEGAIFSKAYGVTNLEEPKDANTKTVFAIASLSKAFTAAAIGILVDDGKLSWNDRVVDHLPYFKLKDTVVSNRMTMVDLLSHRSGFITFDGDLLWYATDYSREEIIKRIAERELTYDFRSEYGYQNIMFIVAGEIIPAVTGKSWEKFVKERILQPLKMTSTYTDIRDFPENVNLAMPHVNGELDVLRSYSNSGGAAALNSNVEDLSKWIRMWLNEGIVDGDTILQPQTVKRLLKLTTPIGPSAFEKSHGIDFDGYALGWHVMEYEGEKVASHGGGLPGYISKIFIVPSKKVGGVVLTNDVSSLPHAMMYKSLDVLLNKENPTDWAALYYSFKRRYEERLAKKQEEINTGRKTGTKSSLNLKNYAGTYEDVLYGKSKIEWKDGKLFLTMLPTKEVFTGELKHWENDRFEIKFKDIYLPRGFVNFEIKDQKVEYFTIDLPNPDFHFHKLKFYKKVDK